MLRVSPKSIYFTWHSLGGALATICSLDVVLDLGYKDVYVTTFGSPKCGNFFCSRIYDSFVPVHWRVAMRSDIITTMPQIGYTHVGKRVALTTRGEMFLDPNAVETPLWSFAVLGIADHTKPVYRKPLKLFTSKYIPGYTPNFLFNSSQNLDEIPSEAELVTGRLDV